MNAYFFDRHRGCFEGILYIYQTNGYVKRPAKVPIDLFVCELQFYDLGTEVVFVDNLKNNSGESIMDAFWQSEGYEKPAERLLPTHSFQRRVWLLVEHADSSTAARFVDIYQR